MRNTPRRLLPYFLLFVVVLFFGFPATAWAYIDPATTSYIIQIVSGLIISLSVAFGVFASRLQMGAVTLKARIEAFWLRMRNKRYRQLYAKAKAQKKAERKAAQKLEPRVPLGEYLFKDDRRLRYRALIAALLAGCFSFSFIFFGVFDLLINNSAAMPYPVTMVFSAVSLVAAVTFVALFVVLLVLRGRVFTFVSTTLLAVTVVLYIQGNVMNGSLGQLTGDWLDLSQLVPEVIVNTLLCLAILAIPYIVWRFAPKAHKTLLVFVPSLLIGMQLIALITSFSTTGVLQEKVAPQTFLSDEALYEVAPQNNTIVILLDRLDERFIDDLLASEPDYFDGHFDGFTRYTNNIASTSRTFPSIVNMLTGYPYEFEIPAENYMREAWRGSQFLPALRETGMRSDVYTDYSYAYLDGEDLRQAADNLDTGLPAVDEAAFKSLLMISGYRYMPYLLKPSFWISSKTVEADVELQGEHSMRYQADDHAFYDTLRSDGLSINEELSGNFKFIHLNGTHPPFDTDYDFNVVPREESNQYLQTRFAFALVFEYLNCLKELGLYDNTTIIVTGDHGYTVELDYLGDFYDLSEAQVTGLFVKLAGDHSSPMVLNVSPVSSEQFRPTIWQQANLDFATLGLTYDQVSPDSTQPRTFMFQVGLSGSQEKYVQFFEVHGDANDFANWYETARRPLQDYHGYQGG
ncbi:MAG: LTA synthase family protein [Coriobacteriales bacterium]|jgi:hypothetical protein|nr:LTA synthase family protein [Coriobacteriales bacterium]